VYHGGGGFIHSEVYNMPTWLRRFHIQKINEHVERENKETKKARGESDMGDDMVKGPNINPKDISSTFNFKK
tara:strand:- start:354 stop:569 length:216 start_codon:yes stop_codon:yes gene_type:complete